MLSRAGLQQWDNWFPLSMVWECPTAKEMIRCSKYHIAILFNTVLVILSTPQVNIWYPLSMVSGGTTAKMMVNAMKWDLGKQLYEGTLTRNLGSVIYKVSNPALCPKNNILNPKR